MYSVTRTVTGGTSNTWRELTPASAPSASPAPQSAQVSGNTCTVSSGLSARGNPAPAARSASRAFAEASSSITTSRDAHEAHPGAGGIADTNHNDQESSAEIM